MVVSRTRLPSGGRRSIGHKGEGLWMNPWARLVLSSQEGMWFECNFIGCMLLLVVRSGAHSHNSAARAK